MAAPNATPLTALGIGGFPWSNSVDLLAPGPTDHQTDTDFTRNLYYTYLVPFNYQSPRFSSSFSADGGIGVIATATVRTQFYTYTTLNDAFSGFTLIASTDAADNNSVMLPLLAPGTKVIVFIQVHLTGTGLIVGVTSITGAVSAAAPPSVPVDVGGILITNDNQSFPSSIVGSNGQVAQIRPSMAQGEGGAILQSGIFALNDEGTQQTWIYDAQFNLLHRVPDYTTAGENRALAPIEPDKFVTVELTAVSGTGRARIIDTGGNVLDSFDVAITGTSDLYAAAVSPDGTTLYFTQLSTSATANKIRRVNLSTHAAMADFLPGVANYFVRNILTMADGTVLVAYRRTGVDGYVVRYAADGTLLNTYPYGSGEPDTFLDHIATAVGEAGYFWVWTQTRTATTGYSTFQRVRAADGVVVETRSAPLYENGDSDNTTTNQPFGTAPSCPFLVLRKSLPITTNSFTSNPCCESACSCPKSPTTPIPPTGFPGPVLPPVDIEDFISACEGGGTVFGVDDLTDPENWLYQ